MSLQASLPLSVQERDTGRPSWRNTWNCPSALTLISKHPKPRKWACKKLLSTDWQSCTRYHRNTGAHTIWDSTSSHKSTKNPVHVQTNAMQASPNNHTSTASFHINFILLYQDFFLSFLWIQRERITSYWNLRD